MFIESRSKTLRLRSEERNSSGVVKLYLNSAPPNGVGTGMETPTYKHLTPTGVKTVPGPITYYFALFAVNSCPGWSLPSLVRVNLISSPATLPL